MSSRTSSASPSRERSNLYITRVIFALTFPVFGIVMTSVRNSIDKHAPAITYCEVDRQFDEDREKERQ